MSEGGATGAAGAADKELDELIATVTHAEASRALRAHKDKLLKAQLTTASVLQDTTQQELTGIEIPFGDAKCIKQAFPDGGAAPVSTGGVAGRMGQLPPSGNVQQHLRMLLPQPPITWPQDAAAVQQYLNDHTGMCIPVLNDSTMFALVQQRPDNKLQVVDASALAAAFTAYIVHDPVNRFSKVTTTCVVNEAYRTTIGQFVRLDAQPFAPQFFGTSSVPQGSGSTGSYLVRKRKRPDAFLVANKLTLLVGEDKQEGQMPAALDDIKLKLDDIAMDYYAGSPFLIAYTAAGTRMRFYSIFFQSGSPEVQQATYELDLATSNHRVYMILVMAKLYVLLKHLAQAKQARGQYPLFHRMERSEGTSITFLANAVEKRIKHCNQFVSRFCTTLDAVRLAYKAAEQEGKAAEAERRPPTLITAVAPPAVTNDDTWCVQLRPLLYPCADPHTEQDLLDIGYALCTAAAALHKQGVVHRDFRLHNVMQHKNGRHKVVIDLELAAKAGNKANTQLCEWDDNTLEDGCYTYMSDMYQVGVLLERHSRNVPGLSQQAQDFYCALKAKQLTAADALSRPWLVSREKPQL